MSRDKERLQVLYWLKQEQAPTIGAIAKVIGKHRNTVGSWLLQYRAGGVKAVLERKSLLAESERCRHGQRRH
jgi:DNA-binding transcriptional ArsR family regulator